MDILTFNTGRMYTEQGQRIAAAQIEYMVYFIDADRGIDGAFDVTPAEWEHEIGFPPFKLTQASLMKLYDEGNYRHFDRWGKHKDIDMALCKALDGM